MAVNSVTHNKVGLISRLADFLQFRPNTTKPDFVAGERPLGGISVSQTSKGTFYPTIQGAIDDLAGRCDLPVNSVIVNTDGLTPGFINQNDQLKFTGTIAGTVGSSYMIYVLGFPVLVEATDSAAAVASKAFNVLTDAVVNSMGIKSVEINSGDSSVLNIIYNDYQNHIFEPSNQRGVTITQTVVVEGRAGYGDWRRMGTQDITLTGGSVNGPITLYYFQRVS